MDLGSCDTISNLRTLVSWQDYRLGRTGIPSALHHEPDGGAEMRLR